ncbi:MAG: 2-C-methyl-D-erythritol 2,4-cyclodiphosphate synthase [Victivallaceae bacterium]|nr:2-C-methyl-D-erythritol 2,4-cyclodiphosphate synthase [Victivallaceae bacterium]
MFRIGQGYDVHRLTAGRRLVICGVEIPYEKGLLGHSDADVALHALMDAMLGALALGDIGKLFPDRDPAYLNADSTKLLAAVAALVDGKGYAVANADITVIAQSPKLAPFIETMRTRVAAVLGTEPDQVSVKATTTEKLGFAGRGEGIAAEAVVLLQKKMN